MDFIKRQYEKILLGAVLFGFTALQMRLSRGGRDD